MKIQLGGTEKTDPQDQQRIGSFRDVPGELLYKVRLVRLNIFCIRMAVNAVWSSFFPEADMRF